MKASRCNSLVIAGLLCFGVGCSSVKPPVSRDGYNEYVPHKDIGAKPGSVENPDTGWNSLIVSILQALVP